MYKTVFKKIQSKNIIFRNYKKFDEQNFIQISINKRLRETFIKRKIFYKEKNKFFRYF